jgi:hypothetical protein
MSTVTPGHRGDQLKIISQYGKRTDIWHLVLLWENVLFKESPPSIIVTRNPKLVNRYSMIPDWLRKRKDVITP